MVSMILVSNCPALPTNGSPCSSSSAPGASPTNISDASMLPTPNTTDFRELAKLGHFTQASTRVCNSAKAATLAGSPAEARAVATTGATAAGAGVRIGGIGITEVFGATRAGAALTGGRLGVGAALLLVVAGGRVRARSVSGATATCRTPRACRFSKCRMAASNN